MEYSFGIPSNLDFHLEKRHQNLFTPPHAHHHFEFLFMLDGSMEVSVEETTCVLDKYEIMIIMPYQIHEYKSIGDSTAFVFEFPTKYITEYETNFQDKTFKYPKKKLSEPFLELFKAFSESEKPSGSIRCRILPVAAQVRAILPVFWGISGAYKTTCMAISFQFWLIPD